MCRNPYRLLKNCPLSSWLFLFIPCSKELNILILKLMYFQKLLVTIEILPIYFQHFPFHVILYSPLTIFYYFVCCYVKNILFHRVNLLFADMLICVILLFAHSFFIFSFFKNHSSNNDNSHIYLFVCIYIYTLKNMENGLGLLTVYTLQNIENIEIESIALIESIAKHSKVVQKPKVLLWRYEANIVSLSLPLCLCITHCLLNVWYRKLTWMNIYKIDALLWNLSVLETEMNNV